MDGITAAPISTISEIDCGRCGFIEALQAHERNEHGRADSDYLRNRLRPMWVNRGSLGIPSPLLPFRAGTPQKSASDPLRYSSGDASNRLGAGLRPSPTFFVGYRFDAGTAHQGHCSSQRYLTSIALGRLSDTLLYDQGVGQPALYSW